jgi:hypothetical protein
MAVSGSNVYVTGYLNFAPIYWKNGVPVQLGSKGDAFAVAVVPH